MRAPVKIDELVCQVGAPSASPPATGPNEVEPETLIRQADVALYRAKREGRGQFRFFEPEMDARSAPRARLEMELRQALAAGQVTPYYQPLVDLDRHRSRASRRCRAGSSPAGDVPPEVFIPIAEDSGLIGELGDQLLARPASTPAPGPSDSTLAFNISPVQLRDATARPARAGHLRETGLPPSRLELEITESAIVGDSRGAGRSLDRACAAPACASRSTISAPAIPASTTCAAPFDKIKIDRSFVDAARRRRATARAIVRAIIGLGQRPRPGRPPPRASRPRASLLISRRRAATRARATCSARRCPASEVRALLRKPAVAKVA